MHPAVFLDRDGTINEQMGYINHVSRFHLLPGVGSASRLLNENGIPVVVVTNQSGVARGYFPESLLDEVHGKMHKLLADKGARLDSVYVCPHYPEAKLPAYRVECDYRKPRTGLLTRAAQDLDLETAVNCQVTPVLVLSGYGRGDLEFIGPSKETQPKYVAENLNSAVEWILNDMEKT